MLNLLIAGSTKFSDDELMQIKDFGYDITVIEREDTESIPDLEKYDVVICNWLFVRHDMKQFKRLKAIQLLSAGLDRIPLDYVEEHGIKLENARGIYNIPIAEFVIMVTLDIYKNSRYFYENQKNHQWSKCRDLDEVSDKTVCIVGTGSVGVEVAKKFSTFTSNIIGVDLFPQKKQYFKQIVALEKLKEALRVSDVVVLTLPLTKKTYHMFNADLFDNMKKDVVLINVARGALIDDMALREKLNEGKFRAVVLDVFENEPLDKNYWGWDEERVRIIPHNSFESKRNSGRMKTQIIKNLQEWSTECEENTNIEEICGVKTIK